MKIKDWEIWASKQPIEKLEKIEMALDILYQDETLHREFEPVRLWILRNIIKEAKREKLKKVV